MQDREPEVEEGNEPVPADEGEPGEVPEQDVPSNEDGTQDESEPDGDDDSDEEKG